LSLADLHELLKLRVDIFVVEQQSLYPEIDGRDPGALHLLAEAGGALVGTLRILGLTDDGPVWIGRVAVRADRRGSGLGRRMMQAALARIEAATPGREIRLGAQIAQEGFYRSSGFARAGGEYDDGGIAHVEMARPGSGKA
ncbi:MAG: GNAT family N-acetyltransferase, partial [Pikeienuella sp.]